MISTQGILDQTGIQSAKTLERWAQRGLIPPSQVDRHPSGRGRVAYWPEWVLERCVRIRQLVDAGHGLDQIAAMLGQDWKAEETRWKERKKRYRFAEVSKRMDYNAAVRNFADCVTEKLLPCAQKWGLGQQLLRRIESYLEHEETIKATLQLVRDGLHPVLLITADEFVVVPDFLVSARLANRSGRELPLLVVSVFDEFVSSLGTVFPRLPKAPRVRPAPRVSRGSQGETAFHLVGLSDFELERTAARKKSSRRRT